MTSEKHILGKAHRNLYQVLRYFMFLSVQEDDIRIASVGFTIQYLTTIGKVASTEVIFIFHDRQEKKLMQRNKNPCKSALHGISAINLRNYSDI